MSPNINKPWVEEYLRAALEVDGQKMPERIVAAREAVVGRLKDLEGNSDHHAERHEMQTALDALTNLEDETRIWPKASTAHSMTTLLPKLTHENAAENTPRASSATESIRARTAKHSFLTAFRTPLSRYGYM